MGGLVPNTSAADNVGCRLCRTRAPTCLSPPRIPRKGGEGRRSEAYSEWVQFKGWAGRCGCRHVAKFPRFFRIGWIGVIAIFLAAVAELRANSQPSFLHT